MKVMLQSEKDRDNFDRNWFAFPDIIAIMHSFVIYNNRKGTIFYLDLFETF